MFVHRSIYTKLLSTGLRNRTYESVWYYEVRTIENESEIGENVENILRGEEVSGRNYETCRKHTVLER